MRRCKKRWIRVGRVALAALVAVALGGLWASALAAQVHILHFNDTYVLEPVDGGKLGGMARLGALVRSLRRQHPSALLLFAGDLISPSVMSSVFHGQQMIEALNLLGVDVATLGNHEFDFGDEVLERRLAESNFTWVVANVVDERGLPFPRTVPFVVREQDGVGVGIVGLISPESALLSNPGPRWRFLDPVEAARAAIARMRAMGAQVIVALTHQSMADDIRLLQEVPEIALVVGGHEHEVLREQVGDRLIVKAGSDNRYLGVVTLTVEGSRVTEIADRMETVDERVGEDPELLAVQRRWEAKLSAELDVVIGQAAVELDARNSAVRTQEAALGNLVADAIRKAADAQLAITNGGGIRTNALFPPGPIRRRDVLAWLPFGNVVVKVELTGTQIWQALENGVSQVERVAGRFPQVSGLRFAFDPSRPEGQRILWVEVDGAPLDPQRRYSVATNDFMLRGGDGYSVLSQGRVLMDPASGPLMAEVVIRYIQHLGTVSPAVEGRIVRASGG